MRRRALRARGPRRRLRRGHATSPTSRATRAWRSPPRAAGASRCPSARAERRLEPRHVAADDVPVELRGAGQASRQVNNFCAPEAFAADRLIAVEVLTPGGNWSSYPPHKHDEERPGRGGRARGDLLLRGRAAAASATSACTRRAPTGRSTCCAEVRSGDASSAPRLPRPVDGRARLRPLLPQRDGRARRGARLALHRRPRARLDPRHLGRPGVDPRLPHDRGEEDRHEADRRPGAGALPGQPVQRARRRASSGWSPAASASSATATSPGVGQALLEAERAGDPSCPTTWRATSRRMVHAAAAYARQRNRLSTLACTTSIGPGATNMVTGRGARHDQPPAGAAAARRHLRHPRVASPVLQQLEDPASLRRRRSTTASGRSRASGTASTGPSSSSPALLAAMRVLTDPAETGAVTLRCRRTSRPRPSTGPRALRAARLARAPARRPSPRRWPERPSCCAARAGR